MSKPLKQLKLTSKTFIKPSELKEGQVIKGHYLGHQIDQFDKPSHNLRTTEGDIVLNSAGGLDKLLEQVTPGMYVEITYKGQKAMTSGKYKGKLSHQFDVAASEDVEIIPEAVEAATPSPKKPTAALGKVK